MPAPYQLSGYFKTLQNDEQQTSLGRGSHASICSFEDRSRKAERRFAIVWDEDRDLRIIHFIDELIRRQLLIGSVLFIGERKGGASIIVDREAAPAETEALASLAQGLIDPWSAEISVWPRPGSIINAPDDRVIAYLSGLWAGWALGDGRKLESFRGASAKKLSI
jgi:hypothetical protein